jgi:hypothetical protein
MSDAAGVPRESPAEDHERGARAHRPRSSRQQTATYPPSQPCNLQGPCHEILCLWFFHQTTSPSPVRYA